MAVRPHVSVLMSVFNGEAYVARSIESIISQTWEDFEFIIINDGSTDKTSEVISSFDDPRIKVLDQENQGLVRSLNRGLFVGGSVESQAYTGRLCPEHEIHPRSSRSTRFLPGEIRRYGHRLFQSRGNAGAV